MSDVRHFLELSDIPTADLRAMIDDARVMKSKPARAARPLAGKTLAMIFEKPSTRTRISFEVGVHELGGDLLRRHVAELRRDQVVGEHGGGEAQLRQDLGGGRGVPGPGLKSPSPLSRRGRY